MGREAIAVPPLLADRASGWGGEEGRRWLAALPTTIDRLVARWGLTLDAPLESHVSFVAPATRSDGGQVILKIPMLGVDFPYAQAKNRRYEPVALQAWNGRAAVGLLEVDDDTGGMLLERCDPGSRLADSVTLEEADTIAVDLLTRLWQVPPPALPNTTDRAREWASRCAEFYGAAGQPFERALLSSAMAIAAELSTATGAPVLLHGDFHHNNVLAAQREPWLVIDPLPLVGEREYDAVMFLLFRKGSMDVPEEALNEAIESLCGRLDLDPGRVKRWLYLRLIADALAFLSQGGEVDQLESRQEDLWSARLVLDLL